MSEQTTLPAPAPLPLPARSRGRLWAEIAIVLALSLGASAIYSLVAIANRLTMDTPLAEQTATLNRPLSDRAVFDLVYQLLGILFALAPVALVVYLLWQHRPPRLTSLGLDGRRIVPDVLRGTLLVVIIGVPGLALYVLGRELGVTVQVVPTALDAHWWTVPVLLLSALRAGLLEEVIAIGYLFDRMRAIRFGPWSVILASALLRGTYHLYQGFGAFLGNLAMGILFGWLYQRTGRLLPLIVAHVLIDAIVFVGYPWAAATFDWL